MTPVYSLKAVGRLLCLVTCQISDFFWLYSAGSINIGFPLLLLENMYKKLELS